MSERPRKRWPLKTLVEILPVIIALTALGSYSTIKKVPGVELFTPFAEVFPHVSGWVLGLMGLVFVVGVCGMLWLIYLFSRAPVAPDGGDEG